MLAPNEATILDHLAPGVFDDPIDPPATAEFFADPRHHLAVALDGDVVVGMASGVHYVHPDKRAPELWINEVGVSDAYRGQGVGTRLVETLVAHGASLGCTEAWVLTSPDNDAAKRMYRAAGSIPFEETSLMFTYRMGGAGRDH